MGISERTAHDWKARFRADEGAGVRAQAPDAALDVAAVLKREGLSRIKNLEPPPRVVLTSARSLARVIHLHIKKFGRIERIGHRIHGDRRSCGWHVHCCDRWQSGEKAKEVGDKVAEGAKDIGEKIKEGAKEVGSEVGATKQTVDVKAALMVDKSIDASHIEVDADTKTLTLKGTVPTTTQKAAAEKVAREKAEGYKVRNLLTVVKR